MIGRPYPKGIDCLWLASDRIGHVGVFITAGAGPIPSEALKLDYLPVEDIEELVCNMPVISDVRLLVSVKRPDHFVSLAQRGVFVYDWTDIQRTTREAINAYEPVAVPTKPIKIEELPNDLAVSAKTLKFVDASFMDGGLMDVCSQMSCQQA